MFLQYIQQTLNCSYIDAARVLDWLVVERVDFYSTKAALAKNIRIAAETILPGYYPC